MNLGNYDLSETQSNFGANNYPGLNTSAYASLNS